jgi:VanZ family protein
MHEKKTYYVVFTRLLLVGYLMGIAFYAFRPFQRIPGAQAGAGGPAMEDRAGSVTLKETLSNQMSLEILLKTDSLDQGGPARIVSFSRDAATRNFTLGQAGNGLSFRLRTTETDDNGLHPSLLIQDIFEAGRMQHFVLTYDGERVRLYTDGKLNPKTVGLQGNFENWGRDHLLTLYDEAPGGRPWRGKIEHFSVYDRALDLEEIDLAYRGGTPPNAVYTFWDGGVDQGMRPLKYRNLFIYNDPGSNTLDTILNIIAFVPMAPLLFFACSYSLRQTPLRVLLIAACSGLGVSGLIEYVQRGLAGRVPCGIDIINNFAGTLLGCLLLWLLLRWSGRFFFNTNGGKSVGDYAK